ncbi:BRAMP protein [Bacillus coahuilensis m2-6]|uniref:8-demethyl-8-aminoriboflavin-5'-phosphate (AFP) synthase RosB n=1 Tax=Bacillus coahuilensis TaxID=408580 RepID=UPI0007503E5B|nr:8-demethyl-8-aminoriboflavin-5'-phosphate (AFP) synthase RosB [Bacillus coahuilensis]KUP08134.1 BRAMP protein [Bacillus coahuilensis m2-6]
MRALIVNTSLKKSSETSNTQALLENSVQLFSENDIHVETVRLADYSIGYGITHKKVDDHDQWPEILDKVKEADILLIGTPLWIGEKSSLCTLFMERLYGSSSITNDKGQYHYYNKVAGVAITGNEDGAKDAAKSVIYGLSHIGFTIPPNVDTYWVGEAGPGESYIEAGGNQNEFTQNHSKIMTYNLMHFAKLLKNYPIPAEGNVIE